MKLFRFELTGGDGLDIDAPNEAAATKRAQEIIDDKEVDWITGKILSVREVEKPKPDNSCVEKDGGYHFIAWDIHVAAKTKKEAKQKMIDYYDIDVDKTPVVPKPATEA